MSLMDELVSAGVDSNEFLGNPLKYDDFVATNNLDDSSLSHSVCEDFTVDFTDMKDIYPGSRCKNLYGNVDTTNNNNSLFENCTMNLEQELEQAVTLTGSSMATTSNLVTSIKDHDGDNIGNDVTNNSNDHGDNEIDNNHNSDYGDDGSKFLCGNLVDEYDVTAETDKDISSVVNNFSLERNMEKECTLIKDEINDGNSLGSHLIDTEKTRLSTEIAVDVDMTESPTKITNDVDMIKTRSPTKIDLDVDRIKTESSTEIDIDVDMIKTRSPTEIDLDMDRIKTESSTEIDIDVDMIETESPVKNSNTINSFAAEETLNASIKTEPAYKVTVDCNNANSVTMSSIKSETDHTNKSVVVQSAQDSQLEACESFEDLYLQEKFLKKEREVDSLRKQLDDKQKGIHHAVNFGKQLLEENEELKEKVHKLEQKMITIDEELKNEIHSTKLKLESKEYMEKQYNEEISLLQNEITQFKTEVDSYQKQEATLKRELRNKDDLLEQSNLKEEQLTAAIKNLEKLLLEKAEEVSHYPSQSLCDDNQQQVVLEKEVLELQTECTNLKIKITSSHANTNRVEEELLRVKRRLDEKQLEYEEVRSEMNSYQKTLEVSQREILDLKAQLYAAQVENMNRQDRGNSLFSEVEDRRISVEKTLMALQENYQVLKEKHNLEKQQNYKLKMQNMSYQMDSSKENETGLEYLDYKLSQSQYEIKQLQEKIKHMEKHESQQIDQLTDIQKTFGTNENQGLIDFLKLLNDKKQNDLQVTQEKLNNLQMQYFQESDKVVDYIKKLRLAEEQIKALRYRNMKLKLQTDELISKYKPDEIGNVRNDRKTRTEKIPLSSSENFPEKLKSQKEPSKPEQKLPAQNHSMTHRRKLELARYGLINPLDVLDGSPKAKKTVSMSHDVEIIDQNVNKEQKLASTPSAVSQQTKRKSKGKLIPRKIIEVKAPPDTNGVECAQQ
ncbi:protein Spindly isoform X1 [Octopus sinensis]|uniref:Protein Spindly isoform X1 n=1 Tax=Octopus sinensis TaxID=2607531 RepID=A0A6P7S628_9MOLL|nr:protein Spindly isoform X1 [Octopus sinensis]